MSGMKPIPRRWANPIRHLCLQSRAHTVTSHPYVALSPTLYLSQAALPCPQVSPVPNGDTIEAKRLKDLQDLQEMDAAPSHTSPPSSILNK